MADERAFRQSNGATIRRPAGPTDPPPELPPPGPERVAAPRYGPEASRARLEARRASSPGWGRTALVAGAATLIASAMYNLIVLTTHMDFRILAIASGAFIGVAVKASNPPARPTTHRLVAVALTYLCLASTYVPWFYAEIVHPTEDAGGWWGDASDDDAMDDDRWTPERGPIQVQSLDAPVASAGPGLDARAAVVSVAQASVFPLVLVRSLDVLGLVFLLFALGPAWFLAADE